ncbi:MAG: AAA family ATPase [Lentilactobacillus diolivorans]
MKRAISVGKGFGKHSLTEAMKMATAGDVVVLDPGTYTEPAGFSIRNLKLRGNSTNPKSVKLITYFHVSKNGVFTLENLSVACEKHNTINLDQNSNLTLNNTIVTQTDSRYPALYAASSNITMNSSEIRWQQNSNNICTFQIGSNSYATAKNSIIEGLYLDNSSTIAIESCQILFKLKANSNSIIKGTDVYFDKLNNSPASMTLLNNSEMMIHYLDLPNGITVGHIEHSLIETASSNISDSEQLVVNMDEQSTVNVKNAKVRMLQVQSTSSTETPTPDPKPKKKVSSSEKTTVKKKSDGTNALQQLNNMIGLDTVKEAVRKFIRTAIYNKKRKDQGLPTISQSYHSVYIGNPGTGKTTVARIVAKIMDEQGILPTSKYKEVSRQNLVSENVGGTALKTNEVLEESTGGVLFIDEAYTLYKQTANDFGQEAVDTILKYMEDHRTDLMIIFAGYTKEMQDFLHMNPGLKSRIPNVFDFQDYTPQQISQIGISQLKEKKFNFNEQLYTQAVERSYTASTDHSNGRWVRNFNDSLLQIVADNSMNDNREDLTAILDSDINQLVGGDEKSKQEKIDKLLDQLDKMVGLTNVKKFVRSLVDQVSVDKKLEKQVPTSEKPTYHMAFTGNPGTGKTTVARIVAQIFFNLGILENDTVNEVSRADLVGAYIGHSELKTRTAVRNSLGGVLFIDEAYQLTKGNSENDFGKQVVETLITELENNRDKFIAIFAGYTNEMNDFLNANPGLRSRIPITIHFDDYTDTEIGQIVYNIITKNWKVNKELLIHTASQKYATLQGTEKANGRWARNYAEKLIRQQKSWLAQNPNVENVRLIPDELIKKSS